MKVETINIFKQIHFETKMLRIEDLTLENLKSGNLKRDLPEFYELQGCIENFAPWHFNESVYDHTISVLEELEKIFQRDDSRLINYFQVRPHESYTKRQLLYLSTVFHDIGKPETLVVEDDKRYCPGHEQIGAEKLKVILERFDILRKEKERILQIVGLHGDFCVTNHEKTTTEDYARLKRKYPEIFLDLIVFELADTKGLHVSEEGRAKQNFMIEFYEFQIREFLSRPPTSYLNPTQ